MNRWCLASTVLCSLVTAACGEQGPGDAEIAPGRYTYRASHPLPGTSDAMELSGVLQIDEVTGDALEGRWQVSQLHPELETVEWDGAAYVVWAKPTYGGTAVHRIVPGAAGAPPACEGEYTWVAQEGGEQTVPLECSLMPGTADPVPPLDAPLSPAVRPIRENPN